jgi:plasmid stability protein
MPKVIQVRDVPDDVHKRLKIKAAQQGMTLSELVRRLLVTYAEEPTIDEIYERIKARPAVDMSISSAELVRRGREERMAELDRRAAERW